MRRRALTRLGILGLILLACSCLACLVGVVAERTFLREGNLPFGRRPLTVQPGDVIYEEDFSNPESGWEVYTDEYVEKGYEDRAYKIYVIEKNLTTWATIDQKFSDFIMEVKATPMSGPDENSYGIVFRYQNEDNFYSYEISSDGQFAVMKTADGKRKPLVSWSKTGYVNQGKNSNILEVVCEGQSMDFYVNGEYLTGVNDNTFKKGAIGLTAGTFTRKGVRVDFDNLRVSETESK